MKTILLFLSIAFTGLIMLPAQTTVYFQYDDAGNRIQRTITMPAKNAGGMTQPEIAKDSFNELDYSIYPNPTDGELVIEFKNRKVELNIKYTVHDLSGKMLLEQTNNSTFTIINLGRYANGIYLLRIYYGNKVREWKIVKE